MKIEIDDKIPGEERKKILKVAPVRYALEKFAGHKPSAAEWLGVSVRTLRNIVKSEPELSDHYFPISGTIFKREEGGLDPEEMLDDETRMKFIEHFEKMKSKPGWRYADDCRRNLLRARLLNQYIQSSG